MAKMIKINDHLYQFTAQTSDADFYLEKINKYKNECGCAVGAVFTVLAILIFGVYTWPLDWGILSIVMHGLGGMFFVFLAAGIGKAIGIGIARVRLHLLYKFLIHRQYLEPASEQSGGHFHVNVYQMD